MKKYLLFISALLVSSFVFSQGWPPLNTTGGDINFSIQNIPASYAGANIAILVNGENLGQGTVGAGGSNTSVSGKKGSAADSDLITSIQVYHSGSLFELDLTAGNPANPVVDPFGFGFATYDNVNTPLSVAPVELTSFTGNYTNNTVALNWATASEEDNEFFTVERSTDGVKFEALENIAGAGTTIEAQEYQYIDEDPENGTNYYRLKQTDFDEKFTYSEVIVVETDKTPLTVNIFPNPVVSTANITLPVVEGEVTIKVMDLSGREVLSQIVSNADGQNVQLDMNELQAGMYMVVITNGEQVVTKQIQLTK